MMHLRFGQLQSVFVIPQGNGTAMTTASAHINIDPTPPQPGPFCDDSPNGLMGEGTLAADDTFTVRYSNMKGGVEVVIPPKTHHGDTLMVQLKPHPTASGNLLGRMSSQNRHELAMDTFHLRALVKDIGQRFAQATGDLISVNLQDPAQSTLIKRRP